MANVTSGVFIGIDPGKGGGIAAVNSHGAVLFTQKMPATRRDLLTVLGHGKEVARSIYGGHILVALELVRSSPQMGVVSAFTFGRGLGEIEMALDALRIPFEEVTPRRWQQALGCLTRGDKNVSKARASELFGAKVNITHAIADALLLAEYLRRQERGVRTSQSAK